MLAKLAGRDNPQIMLGVVRTALGQPPDAGAVPGSAVWLALEACAIPGNLGTILRTQRGRRRRAGHPDRPLLSIPYSRGSGARQHGFDFQDAGGAPEAPAVPGLGAPTLARRGGRHASGAHA